MKWCLAEGHRKIDLSFLSRPKVLAVMQDVRAAKPVMRFKVTDSKLKTRRGVMGVKAVTDGSALKLKEASLMIIARACANLPMLHGDRSELRHQTSSERSSNGLAMT